MPSQIYQSENLRDLYKDISNKSVNFIICCGKSTAKLKIISSEITLHNAIKPHLYLREYHRSYMWFSEML